MRIMEITSCIECPNSILNIEDGHRCGLLNKPLQNINSDIIPEFCILETAIHFATNYIAKHTEI